MVCMDVVRVFFRFDCIYDCVSASLLLAKQQSGLAWQTSSTSRYIKYKTVGTIAFHAPCLLLRL